MKKYKFDAIIWDCDGVLIDSEILSCMVSVEFLKKYGVHIELESYIDRFLGVRFSDTLKILEKETGVPLTQLVTKEDGERRADEKIALFERELKSIPHIHEVLKELDGLPMAIASGANIKKLFESLRMTGVSDYFVDELVCSADIVEKGKPEPDIFLCAAERLGVDPKKCLAIEDGDNGTIAAKKAGMTVYGFTGASHMTPKRIQRLRDAGVELLFNDLRELPELITEK